MTIQSPTNIHARDYSCFFRYPRQFTHLAKDAQGRMDSKKPVTVAIVGVGSEYQEPLSVAAVLRNVCAQTRKRLAEVSNFSLFDLADKRTAPLATGLGHNFFDQKPICPIEEGKMAFLSPKAGVREQYSLRADVLKVIRAARDGMQTGFDISKMPLPDTTFDYALANNVLQYVSPQDKRRAIENMVAGLKPGGLLFMKTDKGNKGTRLEEYLEQIKSLDVVEAKQGIFRKIG